MENYFQSFLILIALSAPFGGWAAIHAILYHKDPHSALWWTGFSVFVPFLGPVFYYFFGAGRIERKVKKMRKEKIPIDRDCLLDPKFEFPHEELSRIGWESLKGHAILGNATVGFPLLNGNKLELFTDEPTVFDRMIQSIDKAEKSIALLTYQFDYDRVGKRFCEHLRKAAKRGVEVRVLIDDIGAGLLWSDVDEDLEEGGVKVDYFNPKHVPGRLEYMNMRNHRKLLVVDGREAYTGGMNIVEAYLPDTKNKLPVRDIHFHIEGPTVRHLMFVFMEDWFYTTEETLKEEIWFPELELVGDTVCRVVPDLPMEGFGNIHKLALSAIQQAQSTIRIRTPYFLPDLHFLAAFKMATDRGVKIDIVIPQKSDHHLVDWSCRGTLPYVVSQDCRVWAAPPPFNHAKVMAIDSRWAFIGSSNMDSRSLMLNFELNVEVADAHFAKEIEKVIDEAIPSCRPITKKELDKESVFQKLRNRSVRLFSRYL